MPIERMFVKRILRVSVSFFAVAISVAAGCFALNFAPSTVVSESDELFAVSDKPLEGEVASALDEAGTFALDASFDQDRVVISYSGDVPDLSSLGILRLDALSDSVASVALPEGMTVESALEQLQFVPGVVSAQPNYHYYLLDSVQEQAATNDPYCNNSTGGTINQYYLYSSKVIDAWDYAQVNGSVSVAVIDSGCNIQHPDLVNTVDALLAYDVTQDCLLADSKALNNGDALDHGTHVCGIIAAQANNASGIAGASYNANLIPIRVYNDEGKCTTTDLVSAFTYLDGLIDEGRLLNLRVINMSLGFYGSGSGDSALKSAISSMLTEHDVLTVCAGGNGNSVSNTPNTGVLYPSDYDECVSVTCLNRDGSNTVWSDYNQYKDISAPGYGVYSTGCEGGYVEKNGTSMASPLVAGTAALLFAANPDLTAEEARAALISTATEIDQDEARAGVTGSAGALNAEAAVKKVLADVGGQEPSPVVEDAVSPDPFALSGVPERRTQTGAGTVNQGNLVVLVRFAGDQAGNYDSSVGSYTGYNSPYAYGDGNIRTKWEYLVKQYNTAGDSYMESGGTTVRQYLYTVSEGAHDLVSVFPQTTAEGCVEYITLSGSVSDYVGNDQKLLVETVAKLNAMGLSIDGRLVDTDADGWIDNLTIVPQVESSSFVSHFSPSYFGASIATTAGSLSVSNYVIIDSANMGVDTACHEYVHTLGIRDLYDKSGAYAPVGVWDCMASTYGMPWLLASTREQLGWTTIEEVSDAGEYTLYAHGSGTQAVKVTSPLNTDEYFVVEYRNQAKSAYGGNELDKRCGGNGIIVYRVNPAYNEYGNGDVANGYYGQTGYNVYVFRPGDTTNALPGGDGIAGDSGKLVTGARISASGDLTSFGSTDLTATLADNAIVFSDGSNSGIKVTAVEDGDGCATFQIDFADYDSVGSWSQEFSKSAVTPGISMTTDGEAVYAAVSSEWSSATVWKCVEGEWSQLGGVVSSSDNVSICWHDGALYAIVSNAQGLTLKRFDEQASAWVDTGAALPSSCYSVAGFFELGGRLAVGYVDTSSSAWSTEVLCLEGSTWSSLLSIQGTYSMVSGATVDDGSSFVLVGSGSGMRLIHLDASGIVVGDAANETLPSSYLTGAITAQGDQLYVAAVESNRVNVYAADRNSLEFERVGESAYVSGSTNLNGASVVVANGLAYCGVADQQASMVKVSSYLLNKPQPAPAERTVVDIPSGYSVIENGHEQFLRVSGSGFTLEGVLSATEPGEYTATAILDDSHIWSDGTLDPKAIVWRILKKRTKGDVNGNGLVNIVDAQIAYDIAVSSVYENHDDYFAMYDAADVTGRDGAPDGLVYAEDARAIQYAALMGGGL